MKRIIALAAFAVIAFASPAAASGTWYSNGTVRPHSNGSCYAVATNNYTTAYVRPFAAVCVRAQANQCFWWNPCTAAMYRDSTGFVHTHV
jgi:hypothetical protein